MRCSVSKQRSIHRWIVWVICAVIITASTLTVVMFISHANHEHDHNGLNESCALCFYLAAAENHYKSIFTALIILVFVYGGLSAILSFLKSVDFHFGLITPVCLKVRLNH